MPPKRSQVAPSQANHPEHTHSEPREVPDREDDSEPGRHLEGTIHPARRHPEGTIRPGGSGVVPPTVPLEEYEFLKKKFEDNNRRLESLLTFIQQTHPQDKLPPHLQPRGKDHIEPHHPEDDEVSHPSHDRVEQHNNRKKNDAYYEVVESTFREGGLHTTGRRNNEESTFSVVEARDLKKMIEEILEQKKLVPAGEEQPGRKVPFTDEIMKKPLPKKFKMPQLATYSGKGDPHDHMQSYEAVMLLHGWEDAIMCRAFSLTLTEHARTWFNSLKEGSVSSFDQLREEFINAFIINTRKKKDATYLLTIKQEERESLRDYIERFRAATLEIHDLQVGMAVAGVLQGTRSRDFQKSLSYDQPSTLGELFSRASKFILSEDVMKNVTGG